MRTGKWLTLAMLTLAMLTQDGQAATWFVATNGNDSAAGTNWAVAKLTIQAAIDLAVSNDVVLVNDGVYASGERLMGDAQSNRVVIDKTILVQSVHGPEVTRIVGTGYGPSSIRCVYMAEGSLLIGFTITNGFTRAHGDGGGIYCDSTACVISNCVIANNTSDRYGGGTFNGTLYNCRFSNNRAGADSFSLNCFGGGAYKAVLHDCILVGNYAKMGGGGGASDSLLFNCTLDNNGCYLGGGAINSTLYSCLLTNNFADFGGAIAYGSLYNCMLTGNTASKAGGGTYSDLPGEGGFTSTLFNCTLDGNSSGQNGGGAYSSTLNNCAITRNTAPLGGGAYVSVLANCTVIGNFTPSVISLGTGVFASGGGVLNCTLRNSIVYYNTSQISANYDNDSRFEYSCTWPMPFGLGNFTNAPGLAGPTNPHLISGSPCIDAGVDLTSVGAVDLDGDPRMNGVSIDVGCDEFVGTSLTGSLALTVAVLPGANTTTDYPLSFTASIEGRPTQFHWNFGDGIITSNKLVTSHAYAEAGDYTAVFSAANLDSTIVASTTIHVVAIETATRYVSTNGNDLADGLTWATAKATIQSGITSTPPCGLVLVSNGLYSSGGSIVAGTTTRVLVSNGVAVRSLSGPMFTIIQGQGIVGSNNAVRCAYVGSGSSLEGFTIRYGVTTSGGAGGGVVGQSSSSVISNCFVLSNMASSFGGGCNGGTMYNCLLAGNAAVYGGGAMLTTLNQCIVTNNMALDGGGACASTLSDSFLQNNTALFDGGGFTVALGGGASHSLLFNCSLIANASAFGGGSHDGVLYGCILSTNYAITFGGGSYDDNLFDCSLNGNSSSNGAGAISSKLYGCSLTANLATVNGGGGSRCEFEDCILSDNKATSGGGAYDSSINKCIIVSNSATVEGGGVWECSLTNSTVKGNLANHYGGGAYWSSLYNCLLVENTTKDTGGGAFLGSLYNCTLVGNVASNSGGGVCGGASGDIVYNCIVYSNSAPNGPNYTVGTPLYYSCSVPRGSGTGNMTNDPQFVDYANGNFRLNTNSSCIDAGDNAVVSYVVDLEGRPRIVHNTVDMGAYETILAAWDTDADAIPDWWMWKYFKHLTGLAEDQSRATDSADGTGTSNINKYTADCDPTNPLSFFQIAAISNLPPSRYFCFLGSSNRVYTLNWSTNLVSGIWANVPGQTNVFGKGQFMSLCDNTTDALRFYRVIVQVP